MRRAGDAGQLRVRIMSYASGIDNLLAVAGTRPTPWLYDGRLRMVGVKLYLDGALGSRGAWLKQPYRDAPGQRGLPLVNDTELKNHDEPGGDGRLPGRGPRDRRPGQRHPARCDRGAFRHLYRRPALADRACPDRRSGGPAPLRPPRHHRLDAAHPPDLGPADGRGADGAGAARRRLCLARDARQPRRRSPSAPISRSRAQPLPRPRRRDQPRGRGRSAARRLAPRPAPDHGAGLRRLHHRRRLCRLRRGTARLARARPLCRFRRSSTATSSPSATSARSGERGCSKPMSAAARSGSGTPQPPSAARRPAVSSCGRISGSPPPAG